MITTISHLFYIPTRKDISGDRWHRTSRLVVVRGTRGFWVQSLAQMGCLGELGSDPNPLRFNERLTISSYVTRVASSIHLKPLFAVLFPVEYNRTSVSDSHSCRQNAQFDRLKQQTDVDSDRSGYVDTQWLWISME